MRLSCGLYFSSFGCRVVCECVFEAHCVQVRLLQPLVSRVQSLEGALGLYSSFCSAARRVCDLKRVENKLLMSFLLELGFQ